MRCFFLFSIVLSLSGNIHAQTSGYHQSLEAQRKNQYDSAFYYIDKAINFFELHQYKDSIVLAKVHKADMIWSQSGNQQALLLLDGILKQVKMLPAQSIARVAFLNKKAQIHVHNAEIEKAREYFTEALSHIPANHKPNSTYGNLYNNISWMYLELQDFSKAIYYAEQAKKNNELLYGKDARQLVGVYQSLLLISHDAGLYNDAEQYATELQRLAALHFPSDHPGRGLVHNDIGTLYETMHRYDEALFHRQQMVAIIQKDYAKHKNPQLLAIAYNNMGSLYHLMGELQLSEEYAEKAKQLHEINFGSDGPGFVRPLIHLANAKKDIGKFEEAETLYIRAYDLQKKVASKDWRNLAYAETQYGDLFFVRDEYAEAENWYKKALDNYLKAGIKNTLIVEETKTTLGETYARSGRVKEALTLLQDGLAWCKKTFPKGNIVIAGQYNKISVAWLLNNQPEKALLYSDSVFLELLKVSRLPDSNWISQLPYNYHIIRYLQNRTDIEAALYKKSGRLPVLQNVVSIVEQYGFFLEKSLPALRTQASLAQLAQQHRKIYNAAIEACWILQEKLRGQQSYYLHKAFDFTERSKGLMLRLASNSIMIDAGRGTNNNPIETKDLYWRKRISTLNAQYLNEENKNDSLLTLLTASMEGYYKFQDSILHSKEPQHLKEKYRLATAAVSDIQRRLIHDDQTLLEYAVTENNIFVFIINRDGLSVRQLSPEVLKHISTLKNLYNISAEKFVAAASGLYDGLIQPVLNLVKGKKLMIIPDGELFYLNFELLVPDSREYDFAKMKYLLHNYEVSYQLSATTAIKNLDHRKTEKKALLLTPVFTDEMKKQYLQFVGDSALIDQAYFNLLRLPFSIKAAQQISALVKNDLFTEQSAMESVFRKHAPDYQILHLGTHAEVNNVSPLQSRFFLAKQIPSDSTGKDDGYLHAYEIYGMQLWADLAVLTACETGSGKLSQGEGVMSLAHSFMYAGCPSVIMSLWKIDERSSANIITNFYKYLSKGHNKTEALRLAKLEHIKKSGTASSHPYFWAGMTLMGNENPVFASSSWKLWGGISLTLLLSGIGIWLFIINKRKH